MNTKILRRDVLRVGAAAGLATGLAPAVPAPLIGVCTFSALKYHRMARIRCSVI